MKIGVLSDTHLKGPHPEFKKVIEFHFRDVEKILHAGDFVDWSIVEYLTSQKELIAVCGNMDPLEIRKEVPQETRFALAGCRIGIAHPADGGSPLGIQNRVRNRFEHVDLIVYGHTHNAKTELKGEVLFVNPGSAMGVWPARTKTFAIIEVDGAVKAEIIEIHQSNSKEVKQ